MGKVPKLKNKAPSQKSRAARRAGTPPTDVGDGWKTGKDAAKDDNIPGVLAAQNSGMISKKKKQKPLTRQQRLRKEKGLARAEAVLDQMETKVDKSKSKGRVVQSRRAAWDDLNGGQPPKKTSRAEAAATGNGVPEETMEDASMAIEPQEDSAVPDDTGNEGLDGIS